MYSPSSATGVITVGATDSGDNKPSWCNFGADVDIFAPGVSVVSAWNNGGYAVLSGTSMGKSCFSFLVLCLWTWLGGVG